MASRKVAGKVAGMVTPLAGAYIQGSNQGWAERAGGKSQAGGGWGAMAKAGVGQLAGLLPGGDALLKAAESTAPHVRDNSSSLYPWEDPPAASSAQGASGGAGPGEGATGGPIGPGPGHKIEK